MRTTLICLALLVAAPAVARAQTYAWTDRSEVFIPRVVSAAVDQPNRGRVLIYGGWQENGVRGDTWEWDGYGWIHRQPLHDPGKRAGAATVYDELHGRVILIGGAAEFFPQVTPAETKSTWEWDGRDWSSFTTATAPPLSLTAAAAWDPTQNRMLTFGGFGVVERVPGVDGGPDILQSNGTDGFWQFDGLDWKQIPRSEPWPAPRGLTSMAWDRVRNRLVLFSGMDRGVFSNGQLSFGQSADGSFDSPLTDTWEWDGAAWTLIAAKGPPQTGAANLYWDPAASEIRMVVDSVQNLALAPALYRYTGAAWELVATSKEKARRVVTSAVWSSINQKPLVFGGVLLSSTNLPSSDVSLLEELGGASFETQPTVAQLVPLDRAAGATHGDGSVVLFGGISGTTTTGETYRWNGGRWTQLAEAAPPARYGASMAVAGANQVVLFGGIDDGGARLGDTWLWNGATWAESPAGSTPAPDARDGATMFSLGNAAYLFGGTHGGSDSKRTDTWRFDGSWTLLATPTSPGERERACAAGNGTTAYLGGGKGDFWSFDGTSWSTYGSPAGRGFRTGCGLVFAPTLGEFLIMGGTGSQATEDLGEVAPQETALHQITEDARIDPPVRRRNAVLTTNPISGGLLLTGGLRGDNGQQLADTWQMRALGQACTDTAACGNGAFCTEGLCCEQTSCGPCGTCTDAAHPGLCAPRPAGQAPGCDGAFACNAEGHCRVAPGGACADDGACASGACIKSGDAGSGICCDLGGCTLQCLDDHTLRNPDGTSRDCGPYACAGNDCKSSCTSVFDCTAGAVCTDDGVCVAPETAGGTGDESSCGCRVAGLSPRSSVLGFALLALALGRLKRGRRP